MDNQYSLAYIEEISSGDFKIKKELIDMFISSSQTFVLELRKAFNENQWEKLNKLTHSYFAEIGMFKPHAIIENLVNSIYNYKGEDNKKGAILDIVNQLETQIEKIIISLTSDIAE